jgi:hypothetical protein
MFRTSRAPADDEAGGQRTVVVSAVRADGENLVAPADQNHIIVSARPLPARRPDILKSNARREVRLRCAVRVGHGRSAPSRDAVRHSWRHTPAIVEGEEAAGHAHGDLSGDASHIDRCAPRRAPEDESADRGQTSFGALDQLNDAPCGNCRSADEAPRQPTKPGCPSLPAPVKLV